MALREICSIVSIGFPLPSRDNFAGSEFGRPKGGPEGASLGDEASKGTGRGGHSRAVASKRTMTLPASS